MTGVWVAGFKRALWVVGLLVAMPSYGHEHWEEQIRVSGYCSVPLVAILANPERYDGLNVAVAGYYRGGPEVSALFLTRDYGEQLIVGGAVWVSKASQTDRDNDPIPEAAREMFSELAADGRFLDVPAANDHYVNVLGTFHAGPAGRFHAYHGRLEHGFLLRIGSSSR